MGTLTHRLPELPAELVSVGSRAWLHTWPGVLTAMSASAGDGGSLPPRAPCEASILPLEGT